MEKEKDRNKNLDPKNQKRSVQNNQADTQKRVNLQNNLDNNQIFQNPNLEQKYNDYRESIVLKKDYRIRPLLIGPKNIIFLETFSKMYRTAYEFLIAIADPINRPTLIHEYCITKYSLYTAMVLQYDPNDIINMLQILSKNKEIPNDVIEFILINTRNYGSARLFQREGYYYLDILPEVFNLLDKNAIKNNIEEIQLDEAEITKGITKENKQILQIQKDMQDLLVEDSESDIAIQLQKQARKQFSRYKIIGDHFEVTQEVIGNSIPLIQEYDFKNEENKHELDIELKTNVKIRYYQERALHNIFIEEQARSGLIILPCGAGKTIIGVFTVQRLKRPALIICENEVSVDQWRDEFEKWTTVKRQNIIRITGKIADKWEEDNSKVIIITTYSMLTKKRETENKTVQIMKQPNKEWSVCIIDEVHKLPAPSFQNVLKQFKFHFKLGLTATPYREDQKINNLFYMIGPKLYEENWLDLVNQGFLAKPYCVEVRCQMSKIFAQEYKEAQGPTRDLVHTANPTKFNALQYLIKTHEQRNDKILVFCDRPKIIEYYAEQLSYPVIHGGISQDERKKIFNWFKNSNQINTIFVSRVGDTAIDLPQANVGIQLGVHFKSRRQEVQRLGRIMRPKESSEEFNAFWYTLVSQDTDESGYCWFRQRCLIDQGFHYEIIKEENFDYNNEKMQNKFKWMLQLNEKDFLFQLLLNSNNQRLIDYQEEDQSEEIKFQITERPKMNQNQFYTENI